MAAENPWRNFFVCALCERRKIHARREMEKSPRRSVWIEKMKICVRFENVPCTVDGGKKRQSRRASFFTKLTSGVRIFLRPLTHIVSAVFDKFAFVKTQKLCDGIFYEKLFFSSVRIIGWVTGIVVYSSIYWTVILFKKLKFQFDIGKKLKDIKEKISNLKYLL